MSDAPRKKVDPFAVAAARAENAARAEARRQPGTVVHARDGYRYTWISPIGMKPDKVRHIGETLRNRGYLPVVEAFGEDAPEYVPEATGAEIWVTTEEQWQANYARRVRRNEAARAAMDRVNRPQSIDATQLRAALAQLSPDDLRRLLRVDQ